MQLYLLFIVLFFISGCMETPELSSSKGDIAQNKIESNKTEAQKAKEEYLTLQEQRGAKYGS